MKGMVALELGVIERLVDDARAAGLDPAIDPIPSATRRAVHLHGGRGGGLDRRRPLDRRAPTGLVLAAAGAVNECGGVSVTVAGKRLYPIEVAEKGFAPYRIHITGTWGHGSMPRDDNAAVLAARAIERWPCRARSG